LLCWTLSGAFACGGSEDEQKLPGPGDSCEPAASGDVCQTGLSCEPLADGSANVCGAPLTLRVKVQDSASGASVDGARVIALNAEGTPVGEVAQTDAEGAYQLSVPALRNPDGSISAQSTWRLVVAAQGYQIFPAGPRPAVPISGQQASGEPAVIEAANTQVALLALPDAAALDRQIQGTLGGSDAGGTLVVAEGGAVPAPYGIAARDGSFVIFNVPAGEFAIAAYRQGQEFERTAADTRAGSASGLTVNSVEGTLAPVTGNVNIVNAPGGSMTSVVLVPESVFDATLERGPVPLGLRAPKPPELPSIAGAFTVEAVPQGKYVVLAAFENDLLVRDPDASIAGTDIQHVDMAGSSVSMAQSFKITEQLAIVGPGAEQPEPVSGTPVFRWADDSSEDRYELELYSALGDLIWSDRAIPGVSGTSTVERTYEGPALSPGMIYQFRVTSFRDRRGTPTAISRSEDLRGVFGYE
jgi:hypothetical protein